MAGWDGVIKAWPTCCSLLFTSRRRAIGGGGQAALGKRLGRGAASALLLFCVPQLVVGAGSAASGYADFPLAVVYLGAVVYLADYALTHEPGSLRLAAALACLPWIKQEGLLLALCFLALAAAVLAAAEEESLFCSCRLSWPLPLFWTSFLAWQESRPQDFLPLPLATLVGHLDRLGPIVVAVVDELTSLEQWGVVWLAFPVAALLARSAARSPFSCSDWLSLPIILYGSTYLFSAWVPYSLHIASSLPRLLSHVAPLAVLLLGLAMPAQDRGPAGRAHLSPYLRKTVIERSKGSAPELYQSRCLPQITLHSGED
ncbi:MAG: hypothetical protein KIT87_09030 [Anaerolineae bacterium]|nr:hypothetical protein [Anaerolineae bacterium]